MAKLKLGAIADDKPVKLTVELPAAVHRELLAYAEVLGARNRAGDHRTNKADRADVGAVYGNGSRIRKNRVAQLKRDQVATDSALRIASGNLPMPDCHCPISQCAE